MSFKRYVDLHGEKLKQIGIIVAALNRIEFIINTFITLVFTDNKYINHERIYFVTEMLNDQKIFCKFEEKRLLFEKVINRAVYIKETKKISTQFDGKKYLELSKKMKAVQEVRNKVVHTNLTFSPEGLAIFGKRRSDSRLILENNGGRNAYLSESVNLDEILNQVMNIEEEGCAMLFELCPVITEIFSYETEIM